MVNSAINGKKLQLIATTFKYTGNGVKLDHRIVLILFSYRYWQ